MARFTHGQTLPEGECLGRWQALLLLSLPESSEFRNDDEKGRFPAGKGLQENDRNTGQHWNTDVERNDSALRFGCCLRLEELFEKISACFEKSILTLVPARIIIRDKLASRLGNGGLA